MQGLTDAAITLGCKCSLLGFQRCKPSACWWREGCTQSLAEFLVAQDSNTLQSRHIIDTQSINVIFFA